MKRKMQPEVFRVPLRVPLRDGVVVQGTLYTLDPSDPGERPVVLQRTCYDRYLPSYVEAATYLAQHGYNAVVVESRGRNSSEGNWQPHETEATDGYDTIEWVAQQPFCNGRVGSLGGSYSGWNQLAAESSEPESLVTMIVTSAHLQLMQAYARDRDFKLPRALTWVYKMSHPSMRPINDIDWDALLMAYPLESAGDELGPETAAMWRRWMTNDLRKTDPVRSEAPVHLRVPTLHISGWEDEPGQTGVYTRAIRSGSPSQYLLVGPWDHPGTRNPRQVTRGIDYGPHAAIDIHRVYLDWFDRFLRNETSSSSDESTVAVFMNGRNEWVRYKSWPCSTEHLALELGSDGNGLRSVGDKELPVSLIHDPDMPVSAAKSLQYSDVEARNTLTALDQHPNVLTFTSSPLNRPVSLSGYATLQLEVESDETFDWCVWLAELDSAGRPTRVTSNGERVPQGRKRVELKLGPVAHEFQSNSSIRIYVSGSNFPVWDVLGRHDQEELQPPRSALLHNGKLVLETDSSPDVVAIGDAGLEWTAP